VHAVISGFSAFHYLQLNPCFAWPTNWQQYDKIRHIYVHSKLTRWPA